MSLNLNPEAQAARDYAKRCVPVGEKLDLGLLVSSIYYCSDVLLKAVPELLPFLDNPHEFTDETPGEVPLAEDLIPTINQTAKHHPGPITPEEWFVDLLWSPVGMSFAEESGITEETLNSVLPKLKEMALEDPLRVGKGDAPRTGWRTSKQRNEVLKELNEFGRMLTEGNPPQEKLIGMEGSIQAVFRALVKRKQKSALVIGEPGTGKTALIRELARRIMEGHPSVPARIRDHDIFELSPTFLRSGTSLVGQYDERVANLIKALTKHPKIILFVDEVHSLLQSGIHERGNFTDANEAFKQSIAQGDFSLVGATTTNEYRYYLEPDQALVQRFSLVKVEPPTPQATLEILQGRRDEIGGFYGVEISPEVLSQTVDLTEEYLLGRAQPRKSIQLLDEACAYCVTRNLPLEGVTEGALWQALEDTIGHSVVREENLTQDTLFTRLTDKIVGQDRALKGIATAFVSGLGGWVSDRESPRGVFFFGGPTGVGKTETALLLSEILGGGKESLVRVDCNTLQPSGSDSGQALHILLGPPPGYVGYVRGKGGVLSRVREYPESIVLFDEIEKSDPGVGELLLQIMDSGRCEDSDGNLLDFRRAFLVFTTNAGAVYTNPKLIGFDPKALVSGPKTDVEGMKEAIRRMGLGEEFLGRISHFFIFQGLESKSVQTILEAQLEKLQDMAEVRGYQLDWNEGVLGHLMAQWQPRFGVRHLLAILRNRIVEQLSVADAQGELKGVAKIRLALMDTSGGGGEAPEMTGMAVRQRDGDTLVISLG